MHGVGWNFLAHGLSKGINLLTLVILARLLSHDAFGLVAIAVMAISHLAILKNLGLGPALIQKKGNIEEVANTVFTLNIVVGFALTFFAFTLAPLVASYFADPLITPVLRWLGISFFINAIGSIHLTRLQRELAFKKKFLPDMANSFTKGGISIVLALNGYGVLALVFGQLAGALASALVVWVVLPWRPHFSTPLSLDRRLLKYGASIMGIDTLGVLGENIVPIIIGKMFGLSVLGIYTIAYRLPEIMLISMLWIIGGVAFPAFSSIQNNDQEMRKGFLGSIHLVQLFAVPISLGLLITADPIIRVCFGDQWQDAIPMLRLISLYALIYSIGFHAGAVYKAIGRPDILLKLSVLSLAIALPLILFGANYGVLGIITAQLGAILIRRIVSLVIISRFITVSFTDLVTAIKPSLKSGSALLASSLPMLYFTTNLNPLARLLILTISGTIVYLSVLWLVDKSTLLNLCGILNSSKNIRCIDVTQSSSE